ncbi:MAG: NAD(+) diphosphatase [Rectinemataceae bacterium]|nr:NAD(+) diphosphatase [Rectinemataceae bacterium]
MPHTLHSHPVSRVFVFAGLDLIVPGSPPDQSWFDANLVLPGNTSIPGPDDFRSFVWNETGYLSFFAEEETAARMLAAGTARIPVRQAIGQYPRDEVRAFLKGLALSTWNKGARFCGACGSPLTDASGQDSGGRVCAACGRVHFPKISPAVITLVRKGDKALLAHNSRFPAGRFGLIAGFVESGETLEETVHREVREEAGIEVDSIEYRTSQPWPFPDSLMVAFTARWVSGEARPDGDEIAELRWCSPSDLPSIPPPGSVARQLIDEFVDSFSDPAASGNQREDDVGD